MRPNLSDRLRRESLGEQRLGGARHAFEQDVAADQEAGKHQIDDFILADDRFANFAPNCFGEGVDLSQLHQ